MDFHLNSLLNLSQATVFTCYHEMDLICLYLQLNNLGITWHNCQSYTDNLHDTSYILRGHWPVENSLHWVLDVTFSEDNSRIRKDNSPANFAVLRHIAVDIISQNKSRKLSVRKKRFLASLDEECSRELLAAIL
jgi:hypothetical protein